MRYTISDKLKEIKKNDKEETWYFVKSRADNVGMKM
jgi:hypothetical protein